MQKYAGVFHVSGYVVAQDTQQGLAGLHVEVWDKDFQSSDFIGRVTTNANGYFELAFDHSYFDDRFGEHYPDLYFKVYENGQLALSTLNDVLWNVREGDLEVVLEIGRTSQDNETPSQLTKAIPAEYIHAIRQMIARLAGQDTQKLGEMNAHLNLLLEPVAMVNTLISDALDFRAGDSRAAQRFLFNLNRLFNYRPGYYSFQPPTSENNIQPVSLGFASFIPNPNFPYGRLPCLILPELGPQLRFSIDVLIDRLGLDPAIGDGYVQGVEHLLEQLEPLEALHYAAQTALDGQFHHRQYFEDVFNSTRDTQNRQPISGRFSSPPHSNNPFGPSGGFPEPGPIPLPGPFPVPGPIIDLCRMERWARTEQAVRCFREIREGPRYEIDNIYNITRDVSRRGCADDEIEIRGSHLGERGEITFNRREAEIIDWTDTAIRFRVPSNTSADEIGVCIDPGIPACVDFPYACRLPEPGTDHRFEFVQAPAILKFEYMGATVDTTGENSYRAEACIGHEIHAIGAHAEHATITDGSGSVIWDSGEDVPRRVDTRDGGMALSVVLRNDEEYTFTVSNLCGTDQRTISVDIYQRFHIEGPDRVRASEEIELSIRTSCEAEAGGLAVAVSSSAPGSVIPPDEAVIIPEGENSIRVPISGAMPCADAEITIEAPGHDTATKPIYLYDTPQITRVNPTSINACTDFTLEVQGNCFNPTGSSNTVELSFEDGTPVSETSITVRNIRFSDPANRLQQATLEVGVSAIRMPGNYRVRVRSHGLESEWFEGLHVTPVSARIHNFRSSSIEVYPCIDNRLTFSWEVEQAERIEIRGASGLLADSTGPVCANWTGNETVAVNTPGTVELRAFPAGGGSPTTQTIRLVEAVVLQASEVTLFNNTASSSRWIPHDLTVWVGNLTRGTATRDGVIEPGEETTISLSDCNVYGIACVSHYWIEEHNRRHGTSFDPDSRSILAYPQFHKFTLYVLGRDGATPLYFTIEPGEGVNLYGTPPDEGGG